MHLQNTLFNIHSHRPSLQHEHLDLFFESAKNGEIKEVPDEEEATVEGGSSIKRTGGMVSKEKLSSNRRIEFPSAKK